MFCEKGVIKDFVEFTGKHSMPTKVVPLDFFHKGGTKIAPSSFLSSPASHVARKIGTR